MPFPPNFLCSSAAAVAFVATNSLLASADFCPPSGSSSGANDGNKPLSKPTKSCPDFKDGPEQSACCPSQITVGSFFCCTEAHKEQFEAQLASEARRRFISNHLAELVLASLALLVFLVLLGSFLCRRTRFCPMLHRRKSGAGRSSLGGSLDSAEFLGAIRHSHFHSQLLHHQQHTQQNNRLIPRPFPVNAAHQTQRNQRVHQVPYCQRHREAATVAEQQRKQQQQTNCAIPTEAPPPYEEFVRVPPPPPLTLIAAEVPLAPTDCEGEEEEQNRQNTEREGQLRRPNGC
ncbi:hypothetical protein niasHS_011147 [Heterodera schachtii]|uniref:Uncharacterized protein n=1 Tax=Heterodera schachtii TaxID=97005 RepID=A0ABD2IZQ1_HETSC